MCTNSNSVVACPEGGDQRALSGLVSEYSAELVRRRRTSGHVFKTRRALERLIGASGARTLDELTVERIARGLAVIEGARAQNLARTALHALFEWLIRRRRADWNPVVAIEPLDEVPVRPRRALTWAELARLLLAAPARAPVYLLAATSGLRRGELAALAPADLELDRRLVHVRAPIAKSRRGRTVPIPEGTAARLLELGRAGPRLFGSIPRVRTLYRDLARAGIERKTSEGVIDFHAFRVSYATFPGVGTGFAKGTFIKAGRNEETWKLVVGADGTPVRVRNRNVSGRVTVNVAQKLLGHSDARLTLNVYARTRVEESRDAIDDVFRRRDGEERRAA